MTRHTTVFDRLREVLEGKYLTCSIRGQERICHVLRLRGEGYDDVETNLGSYQGARHPAEISYDSVSADGKKWFFREEMPLSDVFSLRYSTRNEIGVYKRAKEKREREFEKVCKRTGFKRFIKKPRRKK